MGEVNCSMDAGRPWAPDEGRLNEACVTPEASPNREGRLATRRGGNRAWGHSLGLLDPGLSSFHVILTQAGGEKASHFVSRKSGQIHSHAGGIYNIA